MYLNGGVVLHLILIIRHIIHRCLSSTNRVSGFSCQVSGGVFAQSSILNIRYLKFVLIFLIPCTLYLIPVSIPAAQAASVDLEWDANAEPELAGYKIYWGTSSSSYNSSKDAGSNTIFTVT